MRALVARLDGRDVLLRDAEPRGQLSLHHDASQRADFSHGLVRELGLRIRCARAAENRRTALGDHVAHVVGLRAEFEVAWVHAGGIVALMADGESWRDRAVRQFIGDSVSQSNASVVCPDLAMPGRHPVFQPRPTRRGPDRLVHGRPEALTERTPCRFLRARSRTISAPPFRDLARVGHERLRAKFARARDLLIPHAGKIA